MATVEEIIFVGTGTSSSVPVISCLTSPKRDCKVCLSTLTPEGRKNIRKNTSLLVRFRKHADPPGARLRNVLIDCGKTFQSSAIEIFPRYGVRELDGVIITHGHADACFGLDDLRGWTLGGAIQPYIDIHLSPESMDVISRTFPFLVDSALATGGGQVADFKFHVFDPEKPFTIHGLDFIPLAAHHGIYQTTQEPYLCYGFKFDDISYISDTNLIPLKTMEIMKDKTKVFIVDCLRLDIPHPSHFILEESIEAARTVNASLKTYFVGFTHRVDHQDFEKRMEEYEKKEGLKVRPAYDGLKVSFHSTHLIETNYFEQEEASTKAALF